jgi:hypothetical protein
VVIITPLPEKCFLSYSGRIYFAIRISKIRLREVITMKHEVEKKLVSLLIESPFYFTLPVKTRYFLLSKLMDQLENVLSASHDEKNINERSVDNCT